MSSVPIEQKKAIIFANVMEHIRHKKPQYHIGRLTEKAVRMAIEQSFQNFLCHCKERYAVHCTVCRDKFAEESIRKVKEP